MKYLKLLGATALFGLLLLVVYVVHVRYVPVNVVFYSAILDEVLATGLTLLVLAAIGFGASDQRLGMRRSTAKTTLLILALLSLSGALYLYENFNARSTIPFNIDTQCFKPRKLEKDGWTSGKHYLTMPQGSSGLTIQLATTQPDVTQRPLTGSIKIFTGKKLLATETLSLNTTGPQQLKISLPAGTVATSSDYQVELTLSRCFIPRNFGMNEDSRRLGVRIEAIHWH